MNQNYYSKIYKPSLSIKSKILVIVNLKDKYNIKTQINIDSITKKKFKIIIFISKFKKILIYFVHAWQKSNPGLPAALSVLN